MFHGEWTKIMKDIFSTIFTSQYSEKVIFDIVKDDKNEQKLLKLKSLFK